MKNNRNIFININNCKIHELNQVFDETTQQITETEVTPIKYPIQPVKYFVREKELEELVDLLNLHTTIAVVGPSGTGKKQIVFQYAFKKSDCYHHIVWFNAESIAVFTDEVHQLAGELGIATKIEDNIRPFHVILKEIYKSFINHCVLFVFDNALDKSVFQYFLKSSTLDDNFTLHIILISQFENWDEEEIYCLKLTTLDELTSYTLLKKELGADYVENSEKLWKDLAGYLGHLPLAIHLVSGYVKQCRRNNLHFDIEKYIHDIDRGSSDEHEDVPYESVKKTLDMLYQEKRSKLARRLLNVCAFLNPYYIDTDSLKCFIDSYDENNFNYALNRIESYSLIKRDGNKIIMHPVIQQWIRLDQKQRHSLETFYKLALQSVLNNENNYVHRTSVLKYASAHIPTILSYSKKSNKDMLQCLSQYGYEQPLDNIFRSESKAKVSQIIKQYGLLHYAIESRNLQIVELICSFNIDVNMQYGFKQNTPLHIASEIGCKNIVEYLLKRKARRNITNIDGHTPVHVASMSLHHDIIDLLIEENANLINKLDKRNRTSLHLALLSHNFGYEEAINKTVTLLLNNGANLKQPDLDGRTVLHYAAKGAFHQTLPLILKNRWELLKIADNMGWTSLHIALTNNSYEHGEHLRNTVSVLIENDQVLKAIGKSGLNELEHEVNDSDEMTALLVENSANMSDQQDKENCEKLVNIQDNMGRTPLQVAVAAYTTKNEKSMTNIIKLLIDKGASLLVADKMGQNVLHYAAKGGRHQVIPILIDKAPELIDMTDNEGRQPLDYAYDKFKSKSDPDFSKTVILLFCKGLVNIKECMHRTTAHYAALCANYRFLDTLLNDYPDLLNQPDAEGWTPLHLAVITDSSIEMNDIQITVELLINKGATVESKNKMGHTVMHLAAGCTRHNIVSLILKQQPALVNVEDNSGRTPLFYALERYGPRRVGNPGEENYSPGNEEYVLETARLLLKYEARTDITVNGFSPFDILTTEQRQQLKSYCDKFKPIKS